MSCKKTAAVFAEEDKLSLHRFKADEAYLIGEGLKPVEAYLSIAEIIRVAKASGADAIHPGYGLLSENPNFVDACENAGITFIGPKAETMRAVGDKASARKVAVAAGVPVIPATDVLGDDFDLIERQAAAVGYPLMLKASWGGGGRGGCAAQTIDTPQTIGNSNLLKFTHNLPFLLLATPALAGVTVEFKEGAPTDKFTVRSPTTNRSAHLNPSTSGFEPEVTTYWIFT